MIKSLTHRNSYLDVLRIFASILVCYNHSDGFHIYLSQDPSGSILSWLLVSSSVITRIDIPLFMMITGAVMLGKERRYQDITKRITRFLVLLAAVSLLKYIFSHPVGFTLQGFFYAVLSGNINMSYWYLYAYLGFLFAQPFLNRIANVITWKDISFLLILRCLLVSALPLANYILSFRGAQQVVLSSDLQIPLATLNVLFYPLVGYYLANVLPLERIKLREVWICISVLFFSIGVSSVVTYHEGVHSAFSQTYLTLFDYSAAIAVFILVRKLLEPVQFSLKIKKILSAWSGFTLGIYLIEPLLAHFAYTPYFNFTYQFHPVIRVGLSLLWCIFIIAGGSLLTYLIRKIPSCKKIL